MSTTSLRRVPVTTGQPFSALEKFERVGTPLVFGERHPVEFVVGVRGESPIDVTCMHVPFCSTVPVFNRAWANRNGRPAKLMGEDRQVASHYLKPVIYGDGSLRMPAGWDGAALLHYVGTVGLDRETGQLQLSEPLAAEMLSLKEVEFDDAFFEHDGSVWAAATLYCRQLGQRHPWLRSRLGSNGLFPQRRSALFELFRQRGTVLRRAQGAAIDLPQGAVATRELGIPQRLCASSC